MRLRTSGDKRTSDRHELIRVATKYPKIAKDYFYNKKHQTVELIKMNGSIELAPIVGLSEVIVDIVETGTTLNENGLVVLEEVCPLSARMIVNPVRHRMENDQDKENSLRLKRTFTRGAMRPCELKTESNYEKKSFGRFTQKKSE